MAFFNIILFRKVIHKKDIKKKVKHIKEKEKHNSQNYMVILPLMCNEFVVNFK